MTNVSNHRFQFNASNKHKRRTDTNSFYTRFDYKLTSVAIVLPAQLDLKWNLMSTLSLRAQAQ